MSSSLRTLIFVSSIVLIGLNFYSYFTPAIKNLTGFDRYSSHLATTAIYHILFFGVGGFILRSKNGKFVKDSEVSPRNKSRITVAGILVILFTTLCYGLLLKNQAILPSETLKNSGSNGWLSFVAICLIGPLLEEYFFRGSFQKLSENLIGSKWAIMLTTVYFTFFHEISNHTPLIVISSLIFSITYYSTKSIKAAVIQHSITNFISWSIIASSSHTTETDRNDYPEGFIIFTLIVTLLMFLAYLMFFWYVKKAIKNEAID